MTDILDKVQELIKKPPNNKEIKSPKKKKQLEYVAVTEQPETLLDTVKSGKQKSKVVKGEQVLIKDLGEDLGETGNDVFTEPPTEIKTERGEADANNVIEIWNNDGKYGISINKVLYEIPLPIYDLFNRTVESQRQLVTEVEMQRVNLRKLKMAMANQ